MKIEFSPAGMPVAPARPAAGDSLEAAFLGEMLKLVMPVMSDGAFGGGAGESHFASFLVEAHADALARRLDLGLTQRMGVQDA
ncbi:hypothetical protein [Paracoccus sphaerophysae]|uniref:hypothetical protein n=1 Tax=Paracoccus sphaerophysae TaxID=690417 RepID=UPI002352045B|nr:hypothetical protein [Paracoccus sphaerophysae]